MKQFKTPKWMGRDGRFKEPIRKIGIILKTLTETSRTLHNEHAAFVAGRRSINPEIYLNITCEELLCTVNALLALVKYLDSALARVSARK